MLKELKGFIAGGYFGISLLSILSLVYAERKNEKTIEQLKKEINRPSANKEEVNE